MHIVDTSGWLEYFADSPQARHFAAAILGTEQLLVPTIVVYEVFKKIMQAFDESKAFQAIAQLKKGRVVGVDEAVALYAGKLSLERKLPMADAGALLRKARQGPAALNPTGARVKKPGPPTAPVRPFNPGCPGPRTARRRA